jgi:hypothetical protein
MGGIMSSTWTHHAQGVIDALARGHEPRAEALAAARALRQDALRFGAGLHADGAPMRASQRWAACSRLNQRLLDELKTRARPSGRDVWGVCRDDAEKTVIAVLRSKAGDGNPVIAHMIARAAASAPEGAPVAPPTAPPTAPPESVPEAALDAAPVAPPEAAPVAPPEAAPVAPPEAAPVAPPEALARVS